MSPVRRLFGGSEPGSIYEHVRRHLRRDGPGLLEDGETLPDEALLEGDLRWAPGALEGAFSRYAEGPVDEAAVREVLSDPDAEVREDARKVLAGEKIEPPTIDLDSEH